MFFRKGIILSFIILLSTSLLSVESRKDALPECLPYTFKNVWNEMDSESQDKAHEQALLISRVLMSEDKRKEPWIMMASIIMNRAEIGFRGNHTVRDVVFDKNQFSAVNSKKWYRYKNLQPKNGNKVFDNAYQIALEIVVMGVPERYKNATHAYYPLTMNERRYPSWDTPKEPMEHREEVEGWVYGSAL